jgi:hypothetical protein
LATEINLERIKMQRISPFLWFDSQAEEAAKFYVSTFKNSKIGKIARYPKEVAEKIGRMPEISDGLRAECDEALRERFYALRKGDRIRIKGNLKAWHLRQDAGRGLQRL